MSRRPPHSWKRKFADAARGVKLGVHGQSSFFVHFFVTAVVVVAGVALDVTRGDWCLLAICIAMVFSTEMFNSALERLAGALHPEHHPQIGESLDIAGAAVLLASLGAAIVGAMVFVPRLWQIFIL